MISYEIYFNHLYR